MKGEELEALKLVFKRELDNAFAKGWGAGAKTVCNMVLNDIQSGCTLEEVVEKINVALGESNNPEQGKEENDELQT